MMLLQTRNAHGRIFYSSYECNRCRASIRGMDCNEYTPGMALDSVDPHDVCFSTALLYNTLPHTLLSSNSVAGIMLLAVTFIMKETRSSVLLTRLAKKLRKESGDNRYRARIEDERGSLRTLILISCTRPLRT